MTVIADKIQCVYLFSMCMHMHVYTQIFLEMIRNTPFELPILMRRKASKSSQYAYAPSLIMNGEDYA